MFLIHIWQNDQIKRFWNYESQFPLNYWSRNEGKKLIKFFSKDINQSKKILDLGCGDGGLLENLIPYLDNNNLGTVYGFDTSLDSISKVNNTFKNNKHFGGAYTDIKYLEENAGKESIDFIFCCEVVEHVYDNDLYAIFDSAKRLLSKKGLFLITTPNNERLEDSYICNPIEGSLFHRWQHVRSWNKTSITKELEKNGFNVLNTVETNVMWKSKFPKNIYRRFRYRERINLFVLSKRK